MIELNVHTDDLPFLAAASVANEAIFKAAKQHFRFDTYREGEWRHTGPRIVVADGRQTLRYRIFQTYRFNAYLKDPWTAEDVSICTAWPVLTNGKLRIEMEWQENNQC